MALVERLDEHGRAAWIALTVLGFFIFPPLGLALLAFIIWSGRMGCGMRRRYAEDPRAWIEEKRARFEAKMARAEERMSGARSQVARWHGRGPGSNFGGPAFAPTGNAAFDEYREATLKRLEEEAGAFRDYLQRLRAARDKEEFDRYMAERRSQRPAEPDAPPAA